mmetsp:Transcript_21201/g.49097  ORF Transcript_21201/g.49097 Transcript_21201/m.49097 type:complete len:207 (-) Transcript_21201:285-905(-)
MFSKVRYHGHGFMVEGEESVLERLAAHAAALSVKSVLHHTFGAFQEEAKLHGDRVLNSLLPFMQICHILGKAIQQVTSTSPSTMSHGFQNDLDHQLAVGKTPFLDSTTNFWLVAFRTEKITHPQMGVTKRGTYSRTLGFPACTRATKHEHNPRSEDGLRLPPNVLHSSLLSQLMHQLAGSQLFYYSFVSSCATFAHCSWGVLHTCR